MCLLFSVGVITPLATRGEREDLDRGTGRERGRGRREGDQDLGAGLGEKLPLYCWMYLHTHTHTCTHMHTLWQIYLSCRCIWDLVVSRSHSTLCTYLRCGLYMILYHCICTDHTHTHTCTCTHTLMHTHTHTSHIHIAAHIPCEYSNSCGYFTSVSLTFLDVLIYMRFSNLQVDSCGVCMYTCTYIV